MKTQHLGTIKQIAIFTCACVRGDDNIYYHAKHFVHRFHLIPRHWKAPLQLEKLRLESFSKLAKAYMAGFGEPNGDLDPADSRSRSLEQPELSTCTARPTVGLAEHLPEGGGSRGTTSGPGSPTGLCSDLLGNEKAKGSSTYLTEGFLSLSFPPGKTRGEVRHGRLGARSRLKGTANSDCSSPSPPVPYLSGDDVPTAAAAPAQAGGTSSRRPLHLPQPRRPPRPSPGHPTRPRRGLRDQRRAHLRPTPGPGSCARRPRRSPALRPPRGSTPGPAALRPGPGPEPAAPRHSCRPWPRPSGSPGDRGRAPCRLDACLPAPGGAATSKSRSRGSRGDPFPVSAKLRPARPRSATGTSRRR